MLWMCACVKEPITDEREVVLVSDSEEIAIGQEASSEVEERIGVYEDAELQGYVDEVGRRVAASSNRPDLPWHFGVIDSPVVNAFALPGGYIYLTRGMLAQMNSEAALVGVLGHGVGHVAARHHFEQVSRHGHGGLGVDARTIFFPDVRPFGDVLGGGLGILFSRFGRDAERESDRLAARYSIAQGYDPSEVARFFSVLDRFRDSERSIPSWTTTHPDPVDRDATFLALVADLREGSNGLESRREAFLQRIEGLVVGENPREGFVCGLEFLHPDFEIRLSFPEGWRVQNTKTVIYAAPGDGSAAMRITASHPGSDVAAESHARRFFGRHHMEYGTGERLRAGPFSAYRAPFRALTPTGRIYGVAGFIVDSNRVYEVIGLTRASTIRRYTPTFHDVIESFDRVRDSAILEIEPRTIHVIQVPRSMTFREAVVSSGMEDTELDEVARLNGMELDDVVSAGAALKVVRRGAP